METIGIRGVSKKICGLGAAGLGVGEEAFRLSSLVKSGKFRACRVYGVYRVYRVYKI